MLSPTPRFGGVLPEGEAKMTSLCLAISVALCTSNGEKANDSGTYSQADVGFWMSYTEGCQVTESDTYKRFYQGLKEKGITVFPGVAMHDTGPTYHLAARNTIASLFQDRGIPTVYPVEQEVGLGTMEGINNQFALFKRSRSLFSEHLRANPIDSGYAVMTEYAVEETVNIMHVIQCYILDSDGEDAFSFLLNSHHRLFNDFGLETEAVESRDKLIAKGTDVVIQALQCQLNALSTMQSDGSINF